MNARTQKRGRNLKLTPQVVRAIKNSPKGKIPPVIRKASSISSKVTKSKAMAKQKAKPIKNKDGNLKPRIQTTGGDGTFGGDMVE